MGKELELNVRTRSWLVPRSGPTISRQTSPLVLPPCPLSPHSSLATLSSLPHLKKRPLYYHYHLPPPPPSPRAVLWHSGPRSTSHVCPRDSPSDSPSATLTLGTPPPPMEKMPPRRCQSLTASFIHTGEGGGAGQCRVT